MLLDIINKESAYLETKINSLQQYSNPDCLLSCNRNHAWYKWVARNIDGSESVLLSKNDEQLASILAKNTYNYYLYNDCIKEKKALDYYIKNHALMDGKSDQYLNNQEVRRLLSIPDSNVKCDYYEWARTEYNKSTEHPENLTVKCISGNIVRSKSEAMIDMALFQNNIPYRYEDTLQFNGIILHPDFSIRHPENGKLFIWEHFGLLDNPVYSANAIKKIQHYINNGFYPNINLIITSETSTNPIDLAQVEAIIKHFFL